MSKIKVLYLAWTGDVGGMEKVVVNLCSFIDKEKYEITVCYLNKYGLMSDLIDDFRVRKVCVSMKSGLDLLGMVRFIYFMKKNRFDILHVHTDNCFANIVVILSHSKKIFHEHMVPYYYKPIKTLLFYKFIIPFYNLVLVVSKYLESEVKNILKNKNIKITILNNFIEIDKFQQKEKDKITSKIRIGYIGRLSDEKNPLLFVDIASLLVDNNKYSFVIFGEGYLKAEVEKKLRNLGLDKKIPILKFSNSIEDVMGQIDVLLLTSDVETFAMTLYEAAANRVLVVARNVGAVSEFVENGKTGFLFEKDSTPLEISKFIEETLKDGDVNRVVSYAFEYILENYDIKKNILKLESIYQDLLT